MDCMTLTIHNVLHCITAEGEPNQHQDPDRRPPPDPWWPWQIRSKQKSLNVPKKFRRTRQQQRTLVCLTQATEQRAVRFEMMHTCISKPATPPCSTIWMLCLTDCGRKDSKGDQSKRTPQAPPISRIGDTIQCSKSIGHPYPVPETLS